MNGRGMKNIGMSNEHHLVELNLANLEIMYANLNLIKIQKKILNNNNIILSMN